MLQEPEADVAVVLVAGRLVDDEVLGQALLSTDEIEVLVACEFNVRLRELLLRFKIGIYPDVTLPIEIAVSDEAI